MNQDELKVILQKGEGQFIEFKESAKGLDKEIVAFANAGGGKLFVGISDKNEIKGINITNKLRSDVQDIARNCDPSVKIDLEEIDNIMLVRVEEGTDKPYKCREGFYLRQGANSQKLKRDEIIDFAITEGKIKFDCQINNKFDFLQDFDEEKLDRYLELAGIEKNISVESTLVNLGVAVKKGKEFFFNNTGVLFFSKNPGNFFFSSKVICVNYQTDEKVNILDRKIFDQGLIDNIEEAINYAKKHIDTEFEIKDLARKEIPQYPYEATRECIVNAIMHRDYFDDTGDILIEIFKHKIVVSNPGGLVSGLKPEDFGKVSRTRNTLVADLLLRTIYVEKLGTGINRIKNHMESANLPAPLFEYDKHSFFVTLFDKSYVEGEKVGEKWSEKWSEKITERQKEILSLIRKNPYISRKQLIGELGINSSAIQKHIEKLKEKKIIERIGPDKGGYWKVREEE